MNIEQNILNEMKELWPDNFQNIINYFEKKEIEFLKYPENIQKKIGHPKKLLLERIRGKKELIEFEKDVLNKIIPKDKLEDGVIYLALKGTEGLCRNVDKAKWDRKEQIFLYDRTKFGHTYEDRMNHFADVINDTIAGFTPFKPIKNEL